MQCTWTCNSVNGWHKVSPYICLLCTWERLQGRPKTSPEAGKATGTWGTIILHKLFLSLIKRQVRIDVILDMGCCPDEPGEDDSASVRYGVTGLCVCLRGRVCVRVYHKTQKGDENCQVGDRTCLTPCFAFGGQGWEGSSLAHCGYHAPNKILHLQ